MTACSASGTARARASTARGDVLRHANAAGTSKHGGVLVMAGDDHGAESSTVPHQSEFALLDAMMPDPQSGRRCRSFSTIRSMAGRCRAIAGSWVGIKCVHDTVESTGVIEAGLAPHAPGRARPISRCRRAGSISGPHDDRLDQEKRLHNFKRHAAVAFAQANRLNQIVFRGGPNAEDRHRLGAARAISTCARRSTSSASTRRWRRRSACGFSRSAWSGRSIPPSCMNSRAGLDLIICVEEKRDLLETHVRELLFNDREHADRDRQEGREGRRSLSRPMARSSRNQIAIAIGERILGRKHWPTGRRTARRRSRRRRRRAQQRARSRGAHSLFLRRLPAQFIDRPARRRARLCRHRLPLDGAVHARAQHRRLDANGRRGRQLDRRGAVLEAQACVPESRRRHLQSFGPARHPRRARVRRQHHLQDPLQRRRRHDRRAGA